MLHPWPCSASAFPSIASKDIAQQLFSAHPSCKPSSSAFRCRASFHESFGSPDSTKLSPFQILGVSEDSSADDIKSAFRTKVKEFHPDVYKGEEDAVLITQRLIEAYEVRKRRSSVV